MFFVFEGIDGSGKSTQIDQFSEWLESHNHSVIKCQDPGSTELGKRLRMLLLGNHEVPIDVRAEMMLFTTARTQLVQEVIRPALAAGKTVVLDRYILSTVVYQGHAGELDPQQIRTINAIATDGVTPDLTLILDLPVPVAMQRLGPSRDRMESRGDDYFRKVRDGFLIEANNAPDQIEVIDASLSPADVQAEIRTRAARRLKL